MLIASRLLWKRRAGFNQSCVVPAGHRRSAWVGARTASTRAPWAELCYDLDVTPPTTAARRRWVFSRRRDGTVVSKLHGSRNQTSSCNVVFFFLFWETRDKIKNQSSVVLKYTCKNCAMHLIIQSLITQFCLFSWVNTFLVTDNIYFLPFEFWAFPCHKRHIIEIINIITLQWYDDW